MFVDASAVLVVGVSGTVCCDGGSLCCCRYFCCTSGGCFQPELL